MSDAALTQAGRTSAPALRLWTPRFVAPLIGLAVALIALATRLYELRDVPRLTDETDEVMLGLAIARGQALPLTNVDAYIGPLWNYLLAAGFLIVGQSSQVPRVSTVAVGLLTVGAAGWLGFEMARRLGWRAWAATVSLGTALLLATSSFHAIVSSRIGWSHCLTPLAMTCALACLIRWERTRDARLLAGLGIGYGLAVHTHPTALAFGPGLLVWALWHWRQTVVRPAGWLAAGLFVLANAPMLIFNLATGFRSLQAAAQVQSAYAGGVATGPSSYGTNLMLLLQSVALLLAGNIGEQRGVMMVVDDPLQAVYTALAVLGLGIAAYARCLAPLLVIVSAIVMLPLVNGKYEPLFNGRYLAPLLPLGLLMIAVGVTTVAVRVSRSVRVQHLVATAGLLALTVFPLFALQGYVVAALRDGPNNRELYRASQIVAPVAEQKPVLMDATLSGVRQSTGREGTGVLDYLIQLDTRVGVRRYQPNDLIRAVERGEGIIVVASPRIIARLDKDYVMDMPPGEDEARRRRRAPFQIVRVVRPV